jgi:hypothetical protein
VAGIPWGKYEREDWLRVPGGARRFALRSNPAIQISRRQYDEHYGSARVYGTYERKAKSKSAEPEQILRPARGRSSALKKTPAEKVVEANRRRVARGEAQREKLIAKLTHQKVSTNKTISLKNFPKGTQIRKFATAVAHAPIEALRFAGEKSRVVFGYWVGLTMVSERDNQRKDVSLFTQRDIKWAFSEADFQKAIEKAQEKSYATLVGMWIAMHLTRAAAIKNGAKVPKRG